MWRCATASTEKLWAPSIFQIDATWIALTALYLLTTAALGRRLTIETHRPQSDAGALKFWAFAFGVFLVMLANRLFNLQFLLTLSARCAALDEGWYGDRRPFQFALVLILAAVGVVVFMRAFLKRTEWSERLVLLGLVALIVFAAIRALSFHWVDAALRAKLLGFSLNGLVEGAALSPVLFGSAFGGDRTRMFVRP